MLVRRSNCVRMCKLLSTSVFSKIVPPRRAALGNARPRYRTMEAVLENVLVLL